MDNEMIAKAEHDAAVTASRDEGVKAERSRIKAIMALPEAKGRETTALHLALTTDIAQDAMGAVLSGVQADAKEPASDQEKPQRAIDAPQGLVLFDPSANNPEPATPKAKSLWSNATGKLNAKH